MKLETSLHNLAVSVQSSGCAKTVNFNSLWSVITFWGGGGGLRTHSDKVPSQTSASVTLLLGGGNVSCVTNGQKRNEDAKKKKEKRKNIFPV